MAAARASESTWNLLLDMDVAVQVRIGRTTMLLGEVLIMGTGSEIEFARSPEDPVELIVSGRVVARGTVMGVRGNYGLKITEVTVPMEGASPQGENE